MISTMRKTAALAPAFATLAAVLITGCAAQQVDRKDLASVDLVAVEKGNFDHVYLPPETQLNRFDSVYLEDAEVTLSDYWLRDRRHDYSERDLERIRDDYGRLLGEAIREELEESTGLKFTDEPEQADVIFTPKLRDLNIYAPDFMTARISEFYTREAGNATFDLVVQEAGSGAVLAQFIDHRETLGLHPLERTNRATNYRHFIRLFERWTNNLAKYLLTGGTVPLKK